MANLLKLTPYQTAYLADRPGECVVEVVCGSLGIKGEDCEPVCVADGNVEKLLRYDRVKEKY